MFDGFTLAAARWAASDILLAADTGTWTSVSAAPILDPSKYKKKGKRKKPTPCNDISQMLLHDPFPVFSSDRIDHQPIWSFILEGKSTVPRQTYGNKPVSVPMTCLLPVSPIGFHRCCALDDTDRTFFCGMALFLILFCGCLSLLATVFSANKQPKQISQVLSVLFFDADADDPDADADAGDATVLALMRPTGGCFLGDDGAGVGAIWVAHFKIWPRRKVPLK